MVDKERRRKLAFHMRQLSVGLYSNDDFEYNIGEDVTKGWLPEHYYRSKLAKTDDPVIIPILELCWGLYDDTRNHKLASADRLLPEDLRVIARCILFLHSNLEYEWPKFDTKSPIFSFSLIDLLLILFTLGQNFRNKRKAQLQAYEELKKSGDFDCWPFYRQADYEQQLTIQPFLAGHSNAHSL
ncbi:MAG TPA: hypothetical protein VK518_11705 [Puia sp.]|nr:hypothetical protein [Puia sp.]